MGTKRYRQRLTSETRPADPRQSEAVSLQFILRQALQDAKYEGVCLAYD